MHSRGKQMDRSSSKFAHRSSCVKLYLCSNPEDSVVERRALRESVFPKLREHCRHTLGLDVRVIDPFESSDPSRWPDENTRRQLIKECRESSAGPFLLAVVGHQYGSASLPTQVEVSEFQLLLQESQQAGVSTQELERAYRRDENSIPSSFCLRHSCCPQTKVNEEEMIKMKAKEEELRKVFQTTVSLCVRDDLMTPERAQIYYRSALDADLQFALDNRHDNDIMRRCLVYVHKVVNAKGEREKRQRNSQLQPESEASTFDLESTPTDGQLLSELCENFLPDLITSSKLLVYTTTTECDPRHGYTTARRRGYAEALCQQVHSDLVGLIDSVDILDSSEEAWLSGALAREQEQQAELSDILSWFYDFSRPEEEKVRAYVEQFEQQCPLVVTGGPCTGKAVLMAHCAQQIKSWLPDCDPVVITYFCHLSINSSPKHLLSSLCCQIASVYHSKASSGKKTQNLDDPNFRDINSNCSFTSNPAPDDELRERDSNQNLSALQCTDPAGIIKADACLSELKERLSSLLSLLPSAKQPLVLILDGLDHIQNNFGSQIIESLPCPLPPCVKVILTASSSRTQALQAIHPQSPPHSVSEGGEKGSGYICVPLGSVDRKQSVKMLASLLSSSGRRVTSGQQVLVNQALTSCGLPLYARLLHLHTALWHSDSDVTESSVPDGVHSSISMLLDHLEQKHGSSIVARAASYITLSKTGLAEAELTDLLSNDDEVLSEYVQQGEGLSSKMRVPQIDVEMFLLDLRRFLIRRTVAGLKVLFWVSRHFKLVVAKRYLSTNEVRRGIHSAMADYFSGRWTCGCAKPLLLKQKSGSNKDANKMYLDRQPASQPFFFSSPPKEVGRVNLRKILELPYHLHESNKWEELEHGLFLSLGFHQAMVRAGLLGDLVAMLQGEVGSAHSSFIRERALIANVLKSHACLLQSSPMQLPTVMETSLLSYLEVFPGLRGYFREIREDRRKRGGGLGVALCPAPSFVPPIQCLKRDATTRTVSVTEAAGTKCGIVAEIMDDGSAWFRKGSECEMVKVSLRCEQEELKFVAVKSSRHFLLLSTECNRLFLWDVTGPEMFLQLKDPLITEFEPESSKQMPPKIEGFVACQKKLFIWWTGESYVSVFDVSSETVSYIQCQSCVTCLACSSDDFYMYCGQEGGTVSIFDINTSSLLSRCSNSTHNAVTLLILCEDKQEVACVDRAGNVTLWDVTVKTQPPRLIKESFIGGKTGNILNTDDSNEVNTLLLCQSHQVTLWDTCDWELWDQFLAPQGKAFTHAVLSQNGNLFLALLDTCPLVLVWRISTGECVLSLEANKQPHTLLKLASDVICVAHDGCLTVWDSETINVAGEAPKMLHGVKEVVVEQTGEWFYTTDGSEVVWRWKFATGLPHASLLHDGPVEKLCLSLQNIHLVTLSAGEIYVWQTETGQNIVRMSGSRATEILITPNGNFGVSISEQRFSRVWKLANGSTVCSIHQYLSDAQVSPESTFLIGHRHGDLLAASLWSGSISKRFSCVVSSERVVAFHTLSEQPEFVVVMVASGALYTWKVAEETVCKHFHLPNTFHCQPENFQMSCDGSYALLSTDNEAIHLLDLSQVRLCSFKAQGPVIKACLDETGRYAAYLSCPTTLEKNRGCSPHAWPVLTVVRLADGERIGSVCLSKNPLTLVVCKRQCVFVGFKDGSVGVYSISDIIMKEEELVKCSKHLNEQQKHCPSDREPFRWLPLAAPNVTWP